MASMNYFLSIPNESNMKPKQATQNSHFQDFTIYLHVACVGFHRNPWPRIFTVTEQHILKLTN
jgi:hypothetical protein